MMVNLEGILSPLIVVDNFLVSPDEWYKELAGTSEDYWEDHQDLGRVLKTDFLMDNMRTLENALAEILYVPCTTISWFCSRLEGEDDFLTVTPTYTIYDYFGVLYLSPRAPMNTGAVFFQHKSGLIEITYNELFSPMFENGGLRDWIVCDTMSNVYNRLLLFPGGRLARVLSGFGETIGEGGLIQVFNITRKQNERGTL